MDETHNNIYGTMQKRGANIVQEKHAEDVWETLLITLYLRW
jgi:hypothetical protein